MGKNNGEMTGKRFGASYRGESLYVCSFVDEGNNLRVIDMSQSSGNKDGDAYLTVTGLELITGLVEIVLEREDGVKALRRCCTRASFDGKDLPGILLAAIDRWEKKK